MLRFHCLLVLLGLALSDDCDPCDFSEFPCWEKFADRIKAEITADCLATPGSGSAEFGRLVANLAALCEVKGEDPMVPCIPPGDAGECCCKRCPYGYVTEEGVQTCECYPDPCAPDADGELPCLSHEECKPVANTCFGDCEDVPAFTHDCIPPAADPCLQKESGAMCRGFYFDEGAFACNAFDDGIPGLTKLCAIGPNGFETKDECKVKCLVGEDTRDAACASNEAYETCRRYYFDVGTIACKRLFGGATQCATGPNGWLTKDDCEAACIA